MQSNSNTAAVVQRTCRPDPAGMMRHMSFDIEIDPVLAAFTRIREAAEAYMDERDRAGLGWVEETVTDVSVHRGLPHVEVIPFTHYQEGRGVGADYLWWWIDRATGECFGMLVQAKRLHQSADRWEVDVRHGRGRQLNDLLATASQFEVPAIYAVYMGGLVFREGIPCSHTELPACLTCRRMAISIITAYQLATVAAAPDVSADLVFSESVPLENLVDPALTEPIVRDLNLRKLDPGELRDFLLHSQDGPREIAKRIFHLVSKRRLASFGLATAERTTVPGAPVFPQVPDDRGHFPGSYYRHILQGLRTSPPTYVIDLQAGLPPPPGIADLIAGVVLVRL